MNFNPKTIRSILAVAIMALAMLMPSTAYAATIDVSGTVTDATANPSSA